MNFVIEKKKKKGNAAAQNKSKNTFETFDFRVNFSALFHFWEECQ